MARADVAGGFGQTGEPAGAGFEVPSSGGPAWAGCGVPPSGGPVGAGCRGPSSGLLGRPQQPGRGDLPGSPGGRPPSPPT